MFYNIHYFQLCIMITVFTPTYNRKNTLGKLYDSLVTQTNQNFEWLIVDDGSTDGTEFLISNFIRENKILIRYYKQVNGGKHRAINKGVELAKGFLFFIVDSDDWLPNDSIETIFNYYNEIKNDKEFCGISGYRAYPNGKKIGCEQDFGILDANSLEFRYKYKIKGDMAEVYLTEIIRQYKFPEFEGEKFCAEGLVWSRIAQKYKLRYFYKNTYYCNYLDDGLSYNSIRNRRNSPNYATLLYKERSEIKELPIKEKIKAYINFWRFSFFNDKNIWNNFKFINFNLLGAITFPFGLIVKLKDDFNNNVRINNSSLEKN